MYLGWCPYMHVLCALAACVPAPSHSITLTFRRRRNATPPRRRTPYAAAMPTLHVHHRGRSPATLCLPKLRRRRRRRRQWPPPECRALGGYVHVYTYVYYYSQRRGEGGVCGAALTAARRAASTYLVVVDI
jgi:hypothetical protein